MDVTQGEKYIQIKYDGDGTMNTDVDIDEAGYNSIIHTGNTNVKYNNSLLLHGNTEKGEGFYIKGSTPYKFNYTKDDGDYIVKMVDTSPSTNIDEGSNQVVVDINYEEIKSLASKLSGITQISFDDVNKITDAVNNYNNFVENLNTYGADLSKIVNTPSNELAFRKLILNLRDVFCGYFLLMRLINNKMIDTSYDLNSQLTQFKELINITKLSKTSRVLELVSKIEGGTSLSEVLIEVEQKVNNFKEIITTDSTKLNNTQTKEIINETGRNTGRNTGGTNTKTLKKRNKNKSKKSLKKYPKK
jgi:hypothetical protein